MRRGLRRFVWITLLLALIGSGIYAFFRSVPEPPLTEIESARLGLAMARDSQAAVYSSEVYNQAVERYDSIMGIWKAENEKFILNRNYEQVKVLAQKVVDLSTEALQLTRQRSENLEARLKSDIKRLNNLIIEINIAFSRFPLPKSTRTQISRGKLLLSEGQVAFQKGQFMEADDIITKSGFLLYEAHKQAHQILEDYFSNHKQWIQWVNKTIDESKQKKIPVIIVDKFARKCIVYKNGQKTHEFDAELGKNWVGDKRHKGDHATPEGMYHVTVKKEKNKTIYHKALLINYPSDDDKERFRKEIARGSLPSSAHIGGLIEIHGHGGKGADWTQGCVALSNSDMDILYRLATVGTPVTIIGSASDLETILKN